jgi:hypothetical protein
VAESEVSETNPVEHQLDEQVSDKPHTTANIAFDAINDSAINWNIIGSASTVEEINEEQEESRSFRLRTSSFVQPKILPINLISNSDPLPI